MKTQKVCDACLGCYMSMIKERRRCRFAAAQCDDAQSATTMNICIDSLKITCCSVITASRMISQGTNNTVSRGNLCVMLGKTGVQ